jgi:GNAT superfamily N-acetyltransferase
VRIVATQASDLPSQLTRIYRLSRIAFARNFLYTELSEAAFAAQYAKILPYVRPELVLLAERGGELVGYLFAVPDLAQASRGATVDTFLIKTVAILPEAALRGLGGVLVARAQEIGHRMGFSRCIHALMHESNVSLNISRHYASSMRRYTLYGRELLP